MIRRRLPAALALLAALLQPALTGAAEARARGHAQAIRPALWVVRDRDTTIYLFGTIHALPPHFEWETAAIRAAAAKADRLVLEAVIDRDTGDTATALLRLGTPAVAPPPLAARVAPRYRARLADMIRRSGAPAPTLDKLKTWAAAMVLFGVTVTGLGVSAADGVEEQLKAQFRAAGKPVEGLETLDQQLGFFDTLSEAQQRQFLRSVLDEDHHDAADFGQMLGAWSHGDERGIQKSFDKDAKTADTLQAVLIARRNQRWGQLLVKRLATPGTQFVAVGAGHLTGPQSVQHMLARHGYRAQRLQ